MYAKRRGQDTKERILTEACQVFAEKGFRDATHAEICRRAGANVASINYYFESKQALYLSAYKHLARKADTLYPLDGGISPSASPEDRLYAFVHSFLSRMFDPERMGSLHRIIMSEMFDPTGLLTETLEKRLTADRKRIQSILRELLGPEVPQKAVEWCEMSIIGQCSMARHPGMDRKGPPNPFNLAADDVDRLAAHIVRFSLAGVREIGRKDNPKKTGSRS